jgi:hypothetical protein
MSMEAQPVHQGEPVLLKLVERVFSRLPQGVPPPLPEAGLGLPPLEVGQVVTATVLDQVSAGRYHLALAGVVVEAMAAEGFQPGVELPLEVVQLKPEVVLHILPPRPGMESEAIDLLRTLLPRVLPAGDSLSQLQQELSHAIAQRPQHEVPRPLAALQDLLSHLLPEATAPTAEQLRAFIRDGGLHYEAKLAQFVATSGRDPPEVISGDLKGLLLQAIRQVEGDAEVSDPAVLLTALRHHLEHIETHQVLNLLAQAHGEPYQLQIPIVLDQALSTAFLSIEPDAKQGKGGAGNERAGYHVLFLLNLENFGQTRIDAHVSSQALQVIFYAEEEAGVTQLRAALPTLQERLQTLGYDAVLLDARPFAQLSPEQRRRCKALGPTLPPGVRLVDVKV